MAVRYEPAAPDDFPPMSPQQGSRQRRRPDGQHRRRARARVLAVLMLLGPAVFSVGCGDVLFVPSPFTPQNVDLVYSRQEDISIVRWRIDSTEPTGSDLKFQI